MPLAQILNNDFLQIIYIMKTLKTLLIAVAALAIAVPCSAKLTASNGLAIGKSLYSLYTQYSADGKLDLTNVTNIKNIATIVSNAKGMDTTTKESGNTSFLTSLISGSNNLVTSENSSSVLSTLSSLSSLDASSITSSVASSAASGLFSKLTKSSKSSTTTSSSASKAGSLLTNLFSGLAK